MKQEPGDAGSSTLFLTATKNIDTAASVNITATNNGVTSSPSIEIGFGVSTYNSVPLTDSFFSYDSSSSYITGFSSAVVSNPSILNTYNCLNLSAQNIA
jgi:hypothetical protein